MADLATTYTLTTPGPDITFNSGTLGDGTDKYWIQAIDGLDGPSVRAPVDPVPFGDGSLIHTFFKHGRRPIFDGVLIIETVPFGAACQAALNVLEDNLRQALESIIAANGTLAWTPTGLAARSLSVRHPGEPPLNIRPIENFGLRQFDFSLVSAAANW
jgi:hypothetical protein